MSSFLALIGNASAAAAVCPLVPLHGRYPTHHRQCRDLRRPADHRHYSLSFPSVERRTSSLRPPYTLSIVHRVFLCALLNLWRDPYTSPLNRGINQLLQA